MVPLSRALIAARSPRARSAVSRQASPLIACTTRSGPPAPTKSASARASAAQASPPRRAM